MEENNNNEQLYSRIEQKPGNCLENHCWKKCLAMVLSAFLGGLLAFYFVMDQMMERQFIPKPPKHNPHFLERHFIDDFEKEYRHDMKSFDDMFKKHHKLQKDMLKNNFGMPDFMMDSVKIKTEFDDNKYNIIINSKPFQDDENKINYNVHGKKLTLFGQTHINDKNTQEDISFSQDFILPENADITNIQKIKDGKNLIITVPLK